MLSELMQVSAFFSRVEEHLESEIEAYMGNLESSVVRSSTAPNLGASCVHSFTSTVDNAMNSTGSGDSGALAVQSFALAVDNATTSTGGDSGAFYVHDFASAVNNAISSTGGDLGGSAVHDFVSAVNNAITSTGGDLGAFPVHDFASVVNNAISSTGGDSGPFHVHDFASAVNKAISSTGGDLGGSAVHDFVSAVNNAITSTRGDLGAFPVHDFASVVNNAISSTGGDSGTFHSPVPMSNDVQDLELFNRSVLVAATNNFSVENMIGHGTTGAVYYGKLVDGREVAIRRVGKIKEFQEIVLGYLLTLMPRLCCKHLVGLVGFCEEKNERLLVYEYMKNGTLERHLHGKGSNVLNSWKMRIKIALDASRGIEYLHNYAVSSITHGGIKSSNIHFDATWTARVSDVGLTFMNNTAGTVGYIDLEYLFTGVLTAKSDVYGLGVVLLELLTGKRPLGPRDNQFLLVDDAIRAILVGELVKILDPRVGPPDVNEAEAVELVAYNALQCVNLERNDRLTMADIVLNLERTLAMCDSSHHNISADTIPVLLTKRKRKKFLLF